MHPEFVGMLAQDVAHDGVQDGVQDLSGIELTLLKTIPRLRKKRPQNSLKPLAIPGGVGTSKTH